MRFRYYLIIVLSLFFITYEVSATSVCIVLSRDIKPYQQALDGIELVVSKKDIVSMNMQGVPSEDIKIVEKIKSNGCKVAVALGSTALKFLKLRIGNMPIVYSMVLGSPGSAPNITGVRLEASPRRVLLNIKELLPSAKNIGIIYSPLLSQKYLSDLKHAATSLGFKLTPAKASSISEAIRSIPVVTNKSDVILMVPDAITSSEVVFQELLKSTYKNSIPIIALSKKHVKQGAISALFTDYKENGRQAGVIIDHILKGMKPSSLPNEYSKKVDLIINIKAAKNLGINIPNKDLSKAKEVYK